MHGNSNVKYGKALLKYRILYLYYSLPKPWLTRLGHVSLGAHYIELHNISCGNDSNIWANTQNETWRLLHNDRFKRMSAQSVAPQDRSHTRQMRRMQRQRGWLNIPLIWANRLIKVLLPFRQTFNYTWIRKHAQLISLITLGFFCISPKKWLSKLHCFIHGECIIKNLM